MKKLISAVLFVLASTASAQTIGFGFGSGVGAKAGTPIADCTTANALLRMDASALLACGGSPAPTYDATNIRLKVGAGSTTQAGWLLGYLGASGFSGIWPTSVTPDTTNPSLVATSTATTLNTNSTGTVNVAIGGSAKTAWGATGGLGPAITAGAATTDVQSLSTTQTWNAAGVTFTGHKYSVTDTASAAGSLHSAWYGGAAGTTALMKLDKNGMITPGATNSTIAINGGFANYGIGFDSNAWIMSFVNSAKQSVLGAGVRTQGDNAYAWSASLTDVTADTGDTFLYRHSAGVIRAGGSSTAIATLIGGGAAVASATALPVPTGNVFHVTGTTTITSITSTNFASGAVITIIFDGVLTFTDGSNLKLAGDFVTTADDTIQLAYDGTNWYEISRSVN